MTVVPALAEHQQTDPEDPDSALDPQPTATARVEDNTAADGIQLSDDQLERLSNLTPAADERHDEANMASIDR